MTENIILRHLPESVMISGREFPVNWGYRAMILIELCMFDPERSDEQKLLDSLNIFFNRNVPGNIEEALKKLLWFYQCGKAESKRNEKGTSRKQAKRSYCFQQDAPYIYAAFRSQYGIDLNDTKNYDLHWWKFHALFESLSENQKISKIMYYRTASTEGCTKAQRRFLNEMKKLYTLEDPNQDLDDKLRLSKRNSDMKAYVRKRAMEVNGHADG